MQQKPVPSVLDDPPRENYNVTQIICGKVKTLAIALLITKGCTPIPIPNGKTFH